VSGAIAAHRNRRHGGPSMLAWQKAGGGFFQSSSVRLATSRPIAENRARRRPPSHAGTFTLPSSRRCGRIARTLTIRLSSFKRSFRSSAGRDHSIEPFAATDAFHGAVGTCLVVASYLLALSPCSDILFRDNETASPAVRAACLRWQSISTRLIEDACRGQSLSQLVALARRFRRAAGPRRQRIFAEHHKGVSTTHAHNDGFRKVRESAR
jgi:hypothetical protein